MHPPRGMDQIVDGGLETHLRQRFACRPVPPLGLIPQREQRLRAAGRGALARDPDRLVHREIRRADATRGLREGAVAAYVAAQLGEGDEDLGGVRDEAARASVADCARGLHQRAGVADAGEGGRLGIVEALPVRQRIEERLYRHGIHHGSRCGMWTGINAATGLRRAGSTPQLMAAYKRRKQNVRRQRPKDGDEFLARALAAQADSIVNGDRKPLAMSGCRGVTVSMPRELPDRWLRLGGGAGWMRAQPDGAIRAAGRHPP